MLALASSTSPTGNVYYVAPNGSDSNPGTISQPFRTIRRGIASLSGGDTLNIRAGTYNEGNIDASTIPNGPSTSSRTTLAAYDGAGTAILLPTACIGGGVLGYPNSGNQTNHTFDGLVFDGTNCWTPVGGGANQIIYLGPFASNINFLNVTIKNAGMANLNSGETTHGVFIGGAQHIQFLKCTLSDNGRGNNAAGGGNRAAGYHYYIAGGDDIIIDGCTHIRSGGYGVHAYSGGDSSTPSNLIVRNSTFSESGITAQQNQLTSSIRVCCGPGNMAYNNLVYNGYSIGIESVSANAQIYNNTVYNNRSWGITVGPNTVIKNNIAYGNNLDGNATDIGGFNFSGSVVSNNLCGQINSTVTPPGACAVVGDPMFVDPANGNFNLKFGSPAINIGVVIPGISAGYVGVPDAGALQSSW